MRVEITITHENGMRTSHQFMVPNDNNVQLVCTNNNNNQRTVYPILRVPNRPTKGQSSLINPHFRRSGAAPGPFICAEYMAKRLRGQTAGLVTEPNLIQTSLTPACYNPSIVPSSDTPFTISDEGVVGPEQHPPKRGPYICKRCGEVFDIFQALGAHMNAHYRAEETTEERMTRQANKNKRKRENGENSNASKARDDDLKLVSSSSNIVSESPHEIMHAAAPNIFKESGENSSENKANHGLEKGFKPEEK